MNNVTFSSKFSPQHDNGERALCWRKYEDKEIPEGIYLVTLQLETTSVVEKAYYNFLKKFNYENGDLITDKVIAYMKLPTPYKSE